MAICTICDSLMLTERPHIHPTIDQLKAEIRFLQLRCKSLEEERSVALSLVEQLHTIMNGGWGDGDD